MLQQHWLEEVKSMQEDPENLTRLDLRKLIEDGANIPANPSMEQAIAKLQALLIKIDDWEDKVQKLNHLSVKSRPTIKHIEELLNEAKSIGIQLTGLNNLKEILNKAKSWSKAVDIQPTDPRNFPYYDTIDELVRKGRTIPVHLQALPVLEGNLAEARAWKERTAKMFLRKNTPYTLMEVLSPRIGVGLQAINKNKKKGEESIGAVYVCDVKLDDSNDSATVVAAFKLAEQREMEAMKNLRQKNVEKMMLDDARFCVCRKAKFGQMLRCELCKDWFHSKPSIYIF